MTRARRADPATRFWGKVERTSDCWEWRAWREDHGYGVTHWRGRKEMAHRVAYVLTNGPVPDGLQLDHLCRNRGCVNPDHLEPVTSRENTLRGDTIPARFAARTCCSKGHDFTPENTYRVPSRPNARVCRTCRRRYAERQVS